MLVLHDAVIEEEHHSSRSQEEQQHLRVCEASSWQPIERLGKHDEDTDPNQ